MAITFTTPTPHPQDFPNPQANAMLSFIHPIVWQYKIVARRGKYFTKLNDDFSTQKEFSLCTILLIVPRTLSTIKSNFSLFSYYELNAVLIVFTTV